MPDTSFDRECQGSTFLTNLKSKVLTLSYPPCKNIRLRCCSRAALNAFINKHTYCVPCKEQRIVLSNVEVRSKIYHRSPFLQAYRSHEIDSGDKMQT